MFSLSKHSQHHHTHTPLRNIPLKLHHNVLPNINIATYKPVYDIQLDGDVCVKFSLLVTDELIAEVDQPIELPELTPWLQQPKAETKIDVSNKSNAPKYEKISRRYLMAWYGHKCYRKIFVIAEVSMKHGRCCGYWLYFNLSLFTRSDERTL